MISEFPVDLRIPSSSAKKICLLRRRKILKAHGEQDPEDLGIKRQAAAESSVKDYLKADMVSLNITFAI